MKGELFGPTTALAIMGVNFCSTNELAKTKAEVSTWRLASGRKRLIQMGELCPAAGSD
jgi:hypothetical protein